MADGSSRAASLIPTGRGCGVAVARAAHQSDVHAVLDILLPRPRM
jgi:hypothetical protein